MCCIRLFLCLLILAFIPLEIEAENCENYDEDGSYTKVVCSRPSPNDIHLIALLIIACFNGERKHREEICIPKNSYKNLEGVEACPPDMVKYNPPCDEATMSQKTCRKPLARSIGVFCDYTRCDCPEPKVWDEAVKICVMIDDCSNQSSVTDEVDVHA